MSALTALAIAVPCSLAAITVASLRFAKWLIQEESREESEGELLVFTSRHGALSACPMCRANPSGWETYENWKSGKHIQPDGRGPTKPLQVGKRLKQGCAACGCEWFVDLRG